MSEHTPTPWKIRNDFGGGWIQGSPNKGETYGDRVANLAKPKTIGGANAAFIVKAVNNHDAMDKLLAEAADFLNACPSMDGMDIGSKITQFRLEMQKGSRAFVGKSGAVGG